MAGNSALPGRGILPGVVLPGVVLPSAVLTSAVLPRTVQQARTVMAKAAGKQPDTQDDQNRNPDKQEHAPEPHPADLVPVTHHDASLRRSRAVGIRQPHPGATIPWCIRSGAGARVLSRLWLPMQGAAGLGSLS